MFVCVCDRERGQLEKQRECQGQRGSHWQRSLTRANTACDLHWQLRNDRQEWKSSVQSTLTSHWLEHWPYRGGRGGAWRLIVTDLHDLKILLFYYCMKMQASVCLYVRLTFICSYLSCLLMFVRIKHGQNSHRHKLYTTLRLDQKMCLQGCMCTNLCPKSQNAVLCCHSRDDRHVNQSYATWKLTMMIMKLMIDEDPEGELKSSSELQSNTQELD